MSTTEKSSTRQRSSVQTVDREETTAMGKSPSELEQGATVDEKQITEGNNTISKGKRLREFKHRVRGKHLEHVPTFKESLIATARQSCMSHFTQIILRIFDISVGLLRLGGSEASPLATILLKVADKFVQG
jgi:hypothetical protein